MKIFFFNTGIGIFSFVCIYILIVLLILPASWLSLLSGFLYGSYLGSIIVFISASIGASVAFFVSKSFFAKKLKSKFISIGAQNCHHRNIFGPFTGSVNASMLKRAGAKYVILGHSENRLEGETNRLIKKKIASALEQKLNIIFCIGETLSQRKKKQTHKVLKTQISKGLKGVKKLNKVLFAYEPVWSIGTGVIPKASDLEKNVNFIRNSLIKNYRRR